jgi:hypothetical protein
VLLVELGHIKDLALDDDPCLFVSDWLLSAHILTLSADVCLATSLAEIFLLMAADCLDISLLVIVSYFPAYPTPASLCSDREFRCHLFTCSAIG